MKLKYQKDQKIKARINLFKTLMDLTSRMDGYLNHQIAYPNPIPILPVAKTLLDKKDTTLLQMAMKSFLKERLSGRFQNFDRDSIQNKNHLYSHSIQSHEDRNLVSIQKNSNEKLIFKRGIKFPIIQSEYFGYDLKNRKRQLNKNQQHSKIQRTKSLVQQKRSQVSSSFDFKTKNQAYDGSVQKKYAKTDSKQLNFLHRSFNLKDLSKLHQNHRQQNNQKASFISAIDYYEKQDLNNEEKQQGKQIRFPQIADRRKMNVSKVMQLKRKKSIFTKQMCNRVRIEDYVWLLISKDKNSKSKRLKDNKLTQISQSLRTPGENSSNQSFLNKDALQKFIINSKISIDTLLGSCFSFFEATNKLVDKCKKQQFQEFMLNLNNQPDRAWCVAIFKFLDTNSNGKVDSSDLFKAHNSISELILKLQNLRDFEKQSIKSYESLVQEKFQQNNSKTTQQKTYTALDEQLLKVKHQGKLKVIKFSKQKTNQSEISTKQQPSWVSILMTNNLQNLKALKVLIQNLNSRILKKDKITNLNPQIEQYTPKGSVQRYVPQIRYLEEALLTKKELKISDLKLILEEMLYQDNKAKKKVIDIDYKNLNIKLSSMYVQTFIAANHNQQSRLNKEYMQQLKDSIKTQANQKGQKNDVLEKNSLSGIDYSQFLEEKLFFAFKNLFFRSFHVKFLDSQ